MGFSWRPLAPWEDASDRLGAQTCRVQSVGRDRVRLWETDRARSLVGRGFIHRDGRARKIELAETRGGMSELHSPPI